MSMLIESSVGQCFEGSRISLDKKLRQETYMLYLHILSLGVMYHGVRLASQSGDVILVYSTPSYFMLHV